MRAKNEANITRMQGELTSAGNPRQRAVTERNIRRLRGINAVDLPAPGAQRGPMLNGQPFTPKISSLQVQELAKRAMVRNKWLFKSAAGPLAAFVAKVVAKGTMQKEAVSPTAIWNGLKGLAGSAKGMVNTANVANKATGLWDAAKGVANAVPGMRQASNFVQKSPGFNRMVMRPLGHSIAGMGAGSVADYAAHEAGIDDTNFTGMGGWGGLLGGVAHGAMGAKGRRMLNKNILGPMGSATVPLTGGRTLGGIGKTVGGAMGIGKGPLATATSLAAIPLTGFSTTDESGKSFNPMSIRDQARRTGERAAVAKGDEMARGFGFNSLAELHKHPIGQGLKGWNTGGIGGAISGAWNAMTPEEQTRLISGLAGGVGLLGGGALAMGGHPMLGAGLGAAGAAGLGYGLLKKSPTPQSLIEGMSPEQQQGLFSTVPQSAWDQMSRPEIMQTLQHGASPETFAGRNEFSGAQGGGMKQ
jgi:hypothetical protein